MAPAVSITLPHQAFPHHKHLSPCAKLVPTGIQSSHDVCSLAESFVDTSPWTCSKQDICTLVYLLVCVCRQPYQLSKLSLASKDVSSHSCIMEPAVLLSLQWQVMRKLELWYLPVSFRTSSCWATISSNSYNRNVFPRFLQKSTSEWCFRNKNEYILDPSQCPTWRPDIRNHGPNISKTKKTESLHPRLMTCRTKHIHHPQAEPKNLSKSPATW